MNFWDFLDRQIARLPSWPSEKQVVMGTTFIMGFMMIIMARNDAALWNVELFKTLITVVIVTGCVNMILAFYFTANKQEDDRVALDQERVALDAGRVALDRAHADTTAKAIDLAITTATGTSSGDGLLKEGDVVALEKQHASD